MNPPSPRTGRLAELRALGGAFWAFDRAFKATKAEGRLQDDTRFRIALVFVAFAAAFSLLAVRAAGTALLTGGEQGAGVGYAPNLRADLTDRNGELLAVNLVHYSLYVNAKLNWDAAEVRRVLTAQLPNLQPQRLERALAGAKPMLVISGLTPEDRTRLRNLGLPGVTFEPEEVRVYPQGELAAHLIGFTATGGEGLAGAERALDARIRADGAEGKAVALSIDLRVQAALEDELKKATAEFRPKGATGLVVNVRTGEVLGMASYPDFNPNRYNEATPDALLNRAAAQVFEMGSTFKTFTVAAGLDTGEATLDTTFDASQPMKIGYRTIRDYHGTNRVVSLTELFTHSSNIAAARLGLMVGPERMNRYFKDLGLTEAARIELAESTRPLQPAKWDADAIASISMGHGMLVTPVALAAAYCAVLNGGELRPLTILRREGAPAGRRVMSPATTEAMLRIMRANVMHTPEGKPVGTGGKADAPGFSVGGKTGTGEKVVGGRYDHSGKSPQVSSFAAVFPTDGPPDRERYFVLILMDEPKSSPATYGFTTGGWVAAPAAGNVINRIAPFLGVQRASSALTPPGAPIRVASAVVQPEAGL